MNFMIGLEMGIYLRCRLPDIDCEFRENCNCSAMFEQYRDYMAPFVLKRRN